MAAKSYRDLQAEVWDTGKCSGCGACTAVCPADALYFEEGTMVASPKTTGYCKYVTDGVECGACYEVCPRTVDQPAGTLGDCLEIRSAKAAIDVPGRQSGGAVTAILAGALDAGLIDAVVTVTEDTWTLKPSSVVITRSDVLVQKAGSRYSWWVPLLAALKTAVIDKKCRRVAVVGVPCVVQAVARMRASRNDLVRPYGGAIRLVIGLFCTETFDYTALVTGKLKTERKIDPAQVRKLDVKGNLTILIQDGTTATIPMAELESCVRPGCRICTDLTSLLADISAGAVGSPAGSTTLVIRTPAGKNMVENAVQRNVLVVSGEVDVAAIEKLAQAKVKKAKGGKKGKN
ncbi:MAG TPA: Coenzyme F420 hydrogenase/dehydrogenase, beta subunit C-terminal domain [Methanoregulaceae archaeon]|nr:Coenzyme F420 hydrogenase/dehydrogenase, beta subunit C-terminal domain [Methanoregulaceae archaeon]